MFQFLEHPDRFILVRGRFPRMREDLINFIRDGDVFLPAKKILRLLF